MIRQLIPTILSAFILTILTACQGNSLDVATKVANSRATADSLYALSNKYNENDDPVAALQALNTAIRYSPDNYLLYLDRGATKINLLMFEEAIPDLLRALSLHPKDEKVYLNLAIAVNNLGQFDQGVAYADTAITINPNWGMAYFVRGESYLFKGDTAQLCQELAQAARLNFQEAQQRILMYCAKNSQTIPSFLKFKPK